MTKIYFNIYIFVMRHACTALDYFYLHIAEEAYESDWSCTIFKKMYYFKKCTFVFIFENSNPLIKKNKK